MFVVSKLNPVIRPGLTLVFAVYFCSLSAIAETPGFLGETSPAEKEAKVHGHTQAFGMAGDWGGLRSNMAAYGLMLEAAYVGEFVRNFDPGAVRGRKETIYHDNLDVTVTLDTEKAGLWPGGTLFVYTLFNHGGFPSANVIGDVQTASNIEASRNQWIIQQAWYQQVWMAGKVSVLAGLYDLNSEFYVSDYASLFIHSSLGIGAEVSANVPTSLFPKAGLALRTRIEPAKGFYFQAAGLDGDPQTRSISASEGTMLIGEGGYVHKKNSFKAGYWLHTANKTFAGQTFKDDYGVYAIIDQELISFEGHAAVGGFIQWGWVPQDRNEVTGYFGSGLHIHGLIPGRVEDDMGIAVARADTRSAAESTIELTYRMSVAPWLALQSSFQWIINPGGDNTASAINVGLLRFEVTL